MNHYCYLCHMSFLSKSQLLSHISSFHQSAESPALGGRPTFDIPSQSRTRGSSGRRSISDRTSLQRNILPSDVLSTPADLIAQRAGNMENACSVPYCDGNYGFPTRPGYLQHMRKKHPHIQLHSSDVKCRYGCEYYFRNETLRDRHERKKTRE